METNLHIEFCAQEKRWDEVNVLLSTAGKFDSDAQEHMSICRSISVLICSHFEGSVKDISKAVTKDLIEHTSFSQLPSAMKMRYVCNDLLPGLDKSEKYASHIVSKLEATNFVASESGLLNIFDHNSHIDGSVLEKYGQYFGVRNLLSIVKESKFEDVFSGDLASSYRLLSLLKRSCPRGTTQFPYKLNFANNDNYLIDISSTKRTVSGESMYSMFLDSVFSRRHGVAHGSELSLNVGLRELKGDVLKIRLLLFGYALVLGLAANRIVSRSHA